MLHEHTFICPNIFDMYHYKDFSHNILHLNHGDSCRCCKKEEDGMGGGNLIANYNGCFIYTTKKNTKKNLPYGTELFIGLECIYKKKKKTLNKNFHNIHA